MSSLVMPCLGLAPDAHALATPKGAMRHAENVVCDLPGIVRGRPNFELGTNKVSTYRPRSMHIFNGVRIVVTDDSGGNWRLESEAATITGDATPPDYDACETKFAEARESMYFTTVAGVKALRTRNGTTLEGASDVADVVLAPGFFTYFRDDTVVSGATGWSAAWCFVVKRTDSNGYVRRSPPGPRYLKRVYTATVPPTMPLTLVSSGSDKIYAVSGSLVAGDEIEIYRTLFVSSPTGTPSADMYLTTVYTVTSADVAASSFPTGTGTILDQRTNAELGEALYTNPQREGALAAKRGPPISQCLALWQSCMWYGRTKDRHRLIVTLLVAGSDNATPTNRLLPVANGIGTFATLANAATYNSTTVVTGIASTVGVKAGDYVTDGGTSTPVSGGTTVPNLTTVVSVDSATQVTLSVAATTTGAGTIRFYSKVVIASVPFAVEQYSPLGNAADYIGFGSSTEALNVDRAETVAGQLVQAINAAAARNGAGIKAYHSGGLGAPLGATGGGGQIIIERTTLAGASFTFTSAQGQAWAPAVPTAGLTSTQEDRPNRVYFSNPDEPEAVQLLNYIDIGSEIAPIQNLVPLTNALLVFKEDGLFRITGYGPDNWSVDCIDESLRLVRPETVAVMESLAYAWTNRGVVEIDETGVRRSLSAGKIDTELFSPQGAILGDDGYHGCRVLVSQRHHLVLVTMPNTAFEAPLNVSTTVYCYAVKTGLWTKWPSLYVRCGDVGSNGVLWTAVDNSLGELEWETRYLLDTPRGYDRNYTIAAWTETASSTAMGISNAQRGEWVPTVGDWVYWVIGSTYWRRIIAVVDVGAGVYTWTLDSAAPSNIASASSKGAVVGTPVLLEWLPSAGGTAGVSLGVWREIVFQMEGEAQVKVSPTDFRVTFAVRHDGAGTASIVGTPPRSTVQLRPYRMGWPRNGSRRADVGPRLSWSEIDWPWRLSGVALVGEGGSERVRRS